MEQAKRQKSRDYPAIGLRRAVELARRILEKDRWTEAPALAAVKNMGYAGLNGGSRPALSALRKYGLLEYIGSGDNLRVKLSDLARRFFLAVEDDQKAELIWEAMRCPQIHADLLEVFPNWELPSDTTLASRLELEFRMQHAAIKPFIADLRDSLEFARSFGLPGPAQEDRDAMAEHSIDPPNVPVQSLQVTSSLHVGGTIKLPMPGSATYIVLPETLDSIEAKRILSWLRKVVTPAVEFASWQDNGDEA